MYELCVKEKFSAAHHIRGISGPCSRNHGHNWELRVFVRTEGLDSNGLAIDFIKIQKALQEVVQTWDHQDLNLLSEFQTQNPTAEIIAKTTADLLSPVLASEGAWIDRVTVWETDQCSATYYAKSN